MSQDIVRDRALRKEQPEPAGATIRRRLDQVVDYIRTLEEVNAELVEEITMLKLERDSGGTVQIPDVPLLDPEPAYSRLVGTKVTAIDDKGNTQTGMLTAWLSGFYIADPERGVFYLVDPATAVAA